MRGELLRGSLAQHRIAFSVHPPDIDSLVPTPLLFVLLLHQPGDLNLLEGLPLLEIPRVFVELLDDDSVVDLPELIQKIGVVRQWCCPGLVDTAVKG
jgi:hypothetical protein